MSDIVMQNIEIMNDVNQCFDVIILCCSSQKQANFWQNKLEKTRGTLLPSSSIILSVEEDWDGGAGNALGTLYAFAKASKLAQDLHQIDLLSLLSQKKISVGLFHTAGKGTRLAPLPGSENNNKPGVKLPVDLKNNEGTSSPLTILEAVIKQTSCYASSRMGRLSVFWGDQVFIPKIDVHYQPHAHVDILCSLCPMMSEEEWKEKGMEKYGLIVVNEENNAAQIEKVTHAMAMNLLNNVGVIKNVGVSLGSFSLSWEFLKILLDEFDEELKKKDGKFDSDPHLWMPITLQRDSYVFLMKNKGIDERFSSNHYDRIEKMIKRFNEFLLTSSTSFPSSIPSSPQNDFNLFGAVDVGQDAYWWDFGQLLLFYKNMMKLTDNTLEASVMRQFLLGKSASTSVETVLSTSTTSDSPSVNSTVDSRSIISSSVINGGRINNSILTNVKCNYIESDGSVLINVVADKIYAKNGTILYNLIGDKDHPSFSTEENDVVVGILNEDGEQLIIKSSLLIDGGKKWEEKVLNNEFTFDEINKKNKDIDPSIIQQVMIKRQEEFWHEINNQN